MFVLIPALEDFLEVKLIKLAFKLASYNIGGIQQQLFAYRFVLKRYTRMVKMLQENVYLPALVTLATLIILLDYVGIVAKM
jgi:hypothetical protein